MIPFIDLHPVVDLVKDAVLPKWTTALDNCELVGGKPVAELEKALCAELKVARTIACANGTDALILALQAAGVSRGDHVALPNLTFWATFEAVVQLGAIPVLIDIDPDDLQMSFSEFSAAFEKYRFKHALLVHLYGWASARTKDFRAFCREREITLVEDGAQCFGVDLDGEPILAGAQLATLSFYPAKVIGSCMDSGAVIAQSAEHEQLIRSLANHGRSTHYSYAHIGWNSRMSSTSAHFLNTLLPHAKAIVENRRALARRYHQAAAAWKKVKIHAAPGNVVENGYLNVLTCLEHTSDEAQKALTERKVATGRTYPETMDQQQPAVGRFVAVSDLARSRAFVNHVVNLPLYYGMPADKQDAVIAAAASLFA